MGFDLTLDARTLTRRLAAVILALVDLNHERNFPTFQGGVQEKGLFVRVGVSGVSSGTA